MDDDGNEDPIRYREVLEQVKADPDSWHWMTTEEQDFLRTVSSRCPVCGQMFRLYDTDKARIRSFCSLACSNASRSVKAWICTLCQRRFSSPTGLQKHIEAMHEGVSEHDYLVAYLESKGQTASRLEPRCPQCGGRRKLNFARARYDDCPCILAERKMLRLKAELENPVPGADLVRLKKRIGGCQSLINRMRHPGAGRAAAPRHATGQGKHRTTPVAASPATEDRLMALNTMASACADLLKKCDVVYAAYYKLLDYARGDDRVSDEMISRNALAMAAARSLNWSDDIGTPDTLYLYVMVCEPGDLAKGRQTWSPFGRQLSWKLSSYQKLMTDTGITEQAALKLAQSGSIEALYPLLGNPPYQAWYRLLGYDKDGHLVFPLNPLILNAARLLGR